MKCRPSRHHSLGRAAVVCKFTTYDTLHKKKRIFIIIIVAKSLFSTLFSFFLFFLSLHNCIYLGRYKFINNSYYG